MGKRGNGEGTIYKRKDGSWTCQITVGRDDSSGKPIRKTFYGKQRKEVADKLKMFLDNKESYVKSVDEITLGEWLTKWLTTYNNDVAFSTYDDYESKINLHIIPALGKINLTALKPLAIQEFYNSKLSSGRVDGREGGLSDRSIRYIHVVLKAALEQAKREGYIITNPTDSTRLPKKSTVKEDCPCFTEEEQKRFLKRCSGERMFALYAFALLTGCRQGEIIALKWKQLNFNENEVNISFSTSKVKKRMDRMNNRREENIELISSTQNSMSIIKDTKTSLSRTIPMCEKLVKIMLEHKQNQESEKIKYKDVYVDSDFVFASKLGDMLNCGWVIKKFKKLLAISDIDDINFHSLRHTFATRLLEAGVNMKVLQVYLGHSTYQQTADTYSHVLPKIKKDEIEHLNELFDC